MKNASSTFASVITAALFAVAPGMPVFARNAADAGGAPTQMVITVLSAKGGSAPERVTPNDISVVEGKTQLPVVSLERLAGDNGALQLFVLLDDSSPTSSVGPHFGELHTFLAALPPTTQVAIGYMQNGTAPTVQAFTTDHEKAAASLRLPAGMPGLNGSPYFTLSDLVQHWPSKEPAPRRAILMLTDGVDRYFGTSQEDDPYVDTAIRNAQKQGVQVYSIYLRDSGAYDRNSWVTNVAQSRLDQVAKETGGYAYFQDFSNPVTMAPFLFDLTERLGNQYQVTLAGLTRRGFVEVKVHTPLAGIKLTAPSRIYVP